MTEWIKKLGFVISKHFEKYHQWRNKNKNQNKTSWKVKEKKRKDKKWKEIRVFSKACTANLLTATNTFLFFLHFNWFVSILRAHSNNLSAIHTYYGAKAKAKANERNTCECEIAFAFNMFCIKSVHFQVCVLLFNFFFDRLGLRCVNFTKYTTKMKTSLNCINAQISIIVIASIVICSHEKFLWTESVRFDFCNVISYNGPKCKICIWWKINEMKKKRKKKRNNHDGWLISFTISYTRK